MSVYFIQNLDPQVLSSRFSNDDSLEPLPGMDEEWRDIHLDKIKMVIDRLPDREADLVRLYFFMSKKQTDIAEIFNITQAAVSYRLKRALERLRFLIELPDATKEDIFNEMVTVLPSELDARIFSEMYASTCQSEVAEILDISQGRVRHRYIANLSRMGQVFMDRIQAWIKRSDVSLFEIQEIQNALNDVPMDKEEKDIENSLMAISDMLLSLPTDMREKDLLRFAQYYKTFVRIRYNFNILREIKLPKWSNRSQKVLV